MEDDKEINGRQLKIKGTEFVSDKSKDKDGGKKDKEKKESESKMWVMLLLVISVVVSLVFSLRADKGWFGQIFSGEKKEAALMDTVEGKKVNKSSSGGLFGPAVYEFER